MTSFPQEQRKASSYADFLARKKPLIPAWGFDCQAGDLPGGGSRG